MKIIFFTSDKTKRTIRTNKYCFTFHVDPLQFENTFSITLTNEAIIHIYNGLNIDDL